MLSHDFYCLFCIDRKKEGWSLKVAVHIIIGLSGIVSRKKTMSCRIEVNLFDKTRIKLISWLWPLLTIFTNLLILYILYSTEDKCGLVNKMKLDREGRENLTIQTSTQAMSSSIFWTIVNAVQIGRLVCLPKKCCHFNTDMTSDE